MRSEIEKIGKRVAAQNPNHQALKNAREWWKTGNKYSNHDFDVLQALISAVEVHTLHTFNEDADQVVQVEFEVTGEDEVTIRGFQPYSLTKPCSVQVVDKKTARVTYLNLKAYGYHK